MAPETSILVASYNHGRFLSTTIESILNQSKTDFELIVVDDGSSDDSLQIATAFAKKDRRLQVISQKNAGTVRTLNRAFERSVGKYVCHLGSDDVLEPHFIESSLQDLEQNKNCPATFCRFSVIDQHGTQIEAPSFPPHQGLSGTPLMEFLIVQNCLGALTGFMRREAVMASGGFVHYFPGAEDWELWLRLSYHGDLRLRMDSGARYRVHGANQTLGNPLPSYDSQTRIMSAHGSRLSARYQVSSACRERFYQRKLFLLAALGRPEHLARCLNEKRLAVGCNHAEYRALKEILAQVSRQGIAKSSLFSDPGRMSAEWSL